MLAPAVLDFINIFDAVGSDIINSRTNKTSFIIKYACHDRQTSLQDHRGPALERECQLEERDKERTGTNPTNVRVFDWRRNSTMQMKKSLVSNMPWTLQGRVLTKNMQGKEERVEQKKKEENRHI
jgi:hypothetical protein